MQKVEKMRFSKEKFTKNAPSGIKRQLGTHINLLDGAAVTFEGECGYIPHYHAEGKEYYLYPVYKSWCDGKD